MKGFFASSQLSVLKAPTRLIPRCGECGLYKHCTSPKMEPSGKGLRRILIVGESPGSDEDEQGKPFVGVSGRFLKDTLTRLGVDLRKDCRITNSLVCRPASNATPDTHQIDCCRPNLIKTIEEFDPYVIIPLGGAAVQSLLGYIYKHNDIGGISRWSGWKIPCQKINTWVCPTFHPAYILRSDKNPVPGILFKQHLKRAVKIKSRPWDEVPDYPSQVEKILDPTEALIAISSFHASEMIAFDYETTTLKPEYAGAEIVCCSISNGDRTIAYPWMGEAVQGTSDLLRSPSIRKIASNLKFEERWTRFVLGHRVANWWWDTMVAAHCLDNRPKITGLKFQAFVLLGAEAHEEHVRPYLRVKGQQMNRIREDVNFDQLLTYCGLDSLLEYKVAQIQMKKIGGCYVNDCFAGLR
jgi:uracil-DNA glycosylase